MPPIYKVKPLPSGRAELEVIAASGRRMMVYRGNRFTAERLAQEYRERAIEIAKLQK